MERIAVRAGRGAALTGGWVILAVAGWLIWLLPGPHLAAVLGVGPSDGSVRISGCHEATDEQGYADGTACVGVFMPRKEGEPQREITLDKAAKPHPAGSVVEVRTARGRAYELSGDALLTWVSVSGFILGPFLFVSLWLFACARHGRWESGDGYFLGFLAWVVGVLVLSVVVAIPVWIFTALFG
ncbi:hypothetical protein [Streptomyces clavifer]|uniref:hypothetical protein n=1 Tax=Streptomyces clavifer TaxID=68188 RepID=UPI0033E14BFB